jgi:hypothetical protein
VADGKSAMSKKKTKRWTNWNLAIHIYSTGKRRDLLSPLKYMLFVMMTINKKHLVDIYQISELFCSTYWHAHDEPQ